MLMKSSMLNRHPIAGVPFEGFKGTCCAAPSCPCPVYVYVYNRIDISIMVICDDSDINGYVRRR